MNRLVLLAVGLLAVVAVGYAVFRYAAPANPAVAPPEIPPDITDPSIREVIAAKRAAAVADPRGAAAWGELGMAFDAHERWDQSQACYRRAMELAPADSRWPFLIAEQLNWRSKGRLDKDEALRLYRLAADRTPPMSAANWTAALSLADLLTELGRTDEAAPLYQRAFEAEPMNSWAAYRVAGILADRGQPEDALRLYQTLARSPYARKKSVVAVAELHRRLGKAKEAEEFERAAEMLPLDASWPNPYAERVAELRRGLALLHDTYFAQERAKDMDGVVATAITLTEQYPSIESQLLLLRAMVNTGDYPAAVAVADDILRVEPGAVTAHSFLGLARLGLADRAQAGGRKEEADRLVAAAAAALRESVRLKPDFAPGHIYLSRALTRLGKHADSEQAARKAITARPEEWEAHLALGEALVAAGRKTEAAAAFEQSAKLAHPDEPGPKRALAELKRK